MVGAVVSAWGSPAQAKELLPGLADGSTPASLTVPSGAPDGSPTAPAGLAGRRSQGDTLTVEGSTGPIPNGAVAALVLVPVRVAGSMEWALVERGEGVAVEPLASLDPTRRSARWTLDRVKVPESALLPGAPTDRIREIVLVVAAAEAVGGPAGASTRPPSTPGPVDSSVVPSASSRV